MNWTHTSAGVSNSPTKVLVASAWAAGTLVRHIGPTCATVYEGSYLLSVLAVLVPTTTGHQAVESSGR